MPASFKIIEHPADVGFIAYGKTLEELFANSALALCSLACDILGIEERERVAIEATGSDVESLLFAWLAEILALSDAEQIFFRRVEVTHMTQWRICGVASGEHFDAARHRAGTYIKAVTFHQLRVERSPGGWRAQVYLDV